MMKRLICWVLALTSMLALAVPAFAHGKTEHDAVIECVLFGNSAYKKGLKDQDKKQKLNDLENAVAVCLDLFNAEKERSKPFDELRSRGIHGIPKKVASIDYPANARTHRWYTHRGWNFVYTDDKGNWEVRKDILRQTVNDVFGFKLMAGKWTLFGISKDFGFDEQCDAFAAFLYYLHILGEYVPGKEPKDNGNKIDKSATIEGTIPLTRLHPGEGNEDVFWELERILPIVCNASVKAGDYSGLEVDIKMLEQEARELGGINDENLQQYRDIVTRLLGHLKSKIPGMLQKEPFFSEVFYPDMT